MGINVKERKKPAYKNMQIPPRKYCAKTHAISKFFADSVSIQTFQAPLHNRCEGIKKFCNKQQGTYRKVHIA